MTSNYKKMENQIKKKKRQTYESIFEDRVKEIDKLSLVGIAEYREKLKAWRIQVVELSREENIKNSRLNYLRGLVKHTIDPLLNYTKQRTAVLNRVLHNGCNANFLKRFYEHAHAILPLYQFQRICGNAIMDEEIENETIEDIKVFMEQCRDRLKDPDGNIKSETRLL